MNLFQQLITTTNYDIRYYYRQIVDDFVKLYYQTYDINLNELGKFFFNNCLILFLDEELIGFNNYLLKLNQYGINKFTHYNLKINAQPVSDNIILINVSGIISANNYHITNKFTETILLTKNLDDNKFYISNLILRLLE